MSILDKIFQKMVDRKIAEYQNSLIENHYNEVENIYNQMRGWRHDYHNHIQALIALAGENNIEIKKYLLNLNDDLTNVDYILKTGNIMVDAILNSKISLASSKEILINAKANVPQNIKILDIDLCVIIGNLIDNAITASLNLNKEDRIIRVYIGVLKNQLYISIANSTSNNIIKEGTKYISTKNKTNHGFGILRVDKIVEKYNGYTNRQNEEDFFVTEILLPLV